MKIYNQDKTQIIENPDLTKGRIEISYIEKTIPEIQEIKEQGHYETIKVYQNGGKDIKWVVDVAGVKYQPERIEKEQIYIYIPYSEEEIKEINLHKGQVAYEKYKVDVAYNYAIKTTQPQNRMMMKASTLIPQKTPYEIEMEYQKFLESKDLNDLSPEIKKYL